MIKWLKYSCIFLIIACLQCAFAAQEAIVVVPKAIIYSDLDMTSPLGYVKRGKKIVVGEVPKNKAQLYPILVSGKIAYIKVQDVTTEKESVDSDRLSVERFTKTTTEKFKESLALSYYRYSSQISLDNQNGTLSDNDSVTWDGLSLKGEVFVSEDWDLGILLNYMWSESGEEKFTAVEFGVAGLYSLYQTKKFFFRLEGQLLGIPFSNYELGSYFRVNGYGFSTGAGLNLAYVLTKKMGLEAYGGMYYTRLTGFDPPKPYGSIQPSFLGTRLGIGAFYQF